jgi:hypothetical protein
MSAVPTSAECLGETDPWPSFRAAVPTAQRIIAGEVEPPDSASGSAGYLAAFRLRVIEVLRGPAPAGGSLQIVGLRSGLPLKVCADTVATLLPGDVVVFALDAIGPDGATPMNTLAYLQKAGDSILTDVETITPAELQRLVHESARRDEWPWVGIVLAGTGALLLVGIGGLLLLLRTRARAGKLST